MLRVVHVDDSPRVSPTPDWFTIDHDFLFASNNSEREHGPEFRVFGDCFFVVFFDVVGEVVHGDIVVLNVFVDLTLSYLAAYTLYGGTRIG